MLEEPPPQPVDARRKRLINQSGAFRLSHTIEKPHVRCACWAEGARPAEESGKSQDARD